MYLTGMVDKRTLEKYEREAKEKGRESWSANFIPFIHRKVYIFGEFVFELDVKLSCNIDETNSTTFVHVNFYFLL